MANKILPVADALKQLYQSLGGDDPEVLDMSTNTELIQEIAKVAEGGGGAGLPEVTEADNGRVLGVDDGEWKAVELNDVVYVTLDNQGDYNLVFGTDGTGEAVTYATAMSLCQEGKRIIFYGTVAILGTVYEFEFSEAYIPMSSLLTQNDGTTRLLRFDDVFVFVGSSESAPFIAD